MIPKQVYTTEFKELTIQRVPDGKFISALVKELGLRTCLRLSSQAGFPNDGGANAALPGGRKTGAYGRTASDGLTPACSLFT